MIGFKTFVKESLHFSYIGTPATTVGDSVVDTIMDNSKKLNGVSKNMTARQIAKKHKVPYAQISSQLKQGQEIEKEHTKDDETALRIAMDHVSEKPDYYTKLKKYVEARNICWKGYKRVRGTERYAKGSCEKITEAKQRIKDPKGGLTAYGRKYFNRKEGSNLKPGVKKIKSSTDARRRGSFLVRHYGGPAKPLVDDKGRPTRHALQARSWGQPIPKTQEDARRLAAKGRKLLDRFKKLKEDAPANNAGSGAISGLKASDLPGMLPMIFVKRFKNRMQKFEEPLLNVKNMWAGKSGGFGASNPR